MKFLRRKPQPEPVDRGHDREEEWQSLLHSFRTRSSVEMSRELYHRQARQRRLEAVRAQATAKGFQGVPSPSLTATAEAEAPPEPPVAAPEPEPPPLGYEEQLARAWAEYDASEADWRRRYGDDRRPTWSFL